MSVLVVVVRGRCEGSMWVGGGRGRGRGRGALLLRKTVC